MIERIKALLARWRDVAELDGLSDHDLADLGFSREQVRRFAMMPADVPGRVTAMGTIFGLTEAELRRDHGAWVDLLETCSQCGDRGPCQQMLDKAAEAQPQDAGFCPNRHSLMALLAMPERGRA